jgi:putative Mn2+ efflux pump MntP
MHSFAQHFDALLLALASSTDNFTVGLSVGIGSKPLPLWVNVVISICNAAGALFAGYGGLWLSQTMPSYMPPLLAALAFGILAVQECRSSQEQEQQHDGDDHHDDDGDKSKNNRHSLVNMSQVVQLALPMTLNNLAGGVAGGAAGLAPLMSASYALFASFLTMAVGHWLGGHLGKTLLSGKTTPSLVSACLLGILCLLTLNEAFSTT